jgi:homoserine O-acetyltransferase
MSATKYIKIDGKFPMHRGGYLNSPSIAYETWGVDYDGNNAILIFTGLSPSAHASSSPEDSTSGWWEDMIGSGLPLDTDRFFIICINSLGSCFGSTGPASMNPDTNRQYRLDFPVLSLEDVAKGGYEVIKALGITKVHTTIGCSMGGMSALSFCVQFPEVSERLISISSSARALPFSIAIRSLQREMIRRDIKWSNGNYDQNDPPIEGPRLARKLGMITYRSAEEWEMRFGRERNTLEYKDGDQFYGDFAVESYLQSQAERFTGQFDANCYLYLSRASDLYDFNENGGSLSKACARLKLKSSLVIGVKSDFLFPIHQQEELSSNLAKVIKDSHFVALDCIKGHDSFLVEMDAFRPVMDDFLSN